MNARTGNAAGEVPFTIKDEIILRREGGPRGVAHDVLDSMIDDLSEPAFRAGLATGMFSAAACARMGVRFIPALIISTTIAFGVEQLYMMAEDIHKSVSGKRDDSGTPRTV